MKKSPKKVLGVALLGMDERSSRLLTLFFKGPCEGFVKIVDEASATVDIIDTHFSHADQLLDSSLKRVPQRVIIVLTSKIMTPREERANLLYLDKPIKTEQMIQAIDWANDVILGLNRQKPFFSAQPIVIKDQSITESKPATPPLPELKRVATTTAESVPEPILAQTLLNIDQKKLIISEEQKKKAKYLSGISVDEDRFDYFIGTVDELNINDVNERYLATYDTKNYYQGYVQYAYQLALSKKIVLQLNSSIGPPLIVLPSSHEIWLESNDLLLKEMASVWIEKEQMNIVRFDENMAQKVSDLNKIQEMYAFLWKLALWTSKGRYPKTIDIDSPVYLKQWPDFTRYVVTPHALRISGLLIHRGPENMLDIATLLNIELRYVYIFISATHALGLAAQAKRQADMLIKTTLPTVSTNKKSLLNRIIDKLKGK